MQDLLAGTLLLACLTVAVASLIALIKPIPMIWMPTRRRALGGLGVAFALFILTAIAMPAPDEKAAVADPAIPIKKAEAPRPKTVELTKEQDELIGFIRNNVMQTLSCGGDMDMTQTSIDKLASNKARPIDVYQEAKRGIKSCNDALVEFNRSDAFDGVATSQRIAAKEAVEPCKKAAKSRKSAMQLAQTLLEADGSLSSVSQYMELRDTAKSDEAACRLNLLSVAKTAGIPENKTEFAQP